ncbi:Nitrous oxide reductase maturation periplasmic protein NosX [Rhodovulum sp. P5]|uniref:FAD:protein FMN transferase n=1 Tax=Rhodovulum sp. P5 TaxID=1564506 RepID=UPI0009C30959|nr:FAD:protein FMN transferase [Rhodovulum sp. P5]ARE40767.1 Nitrous oxide reductase maturation periplasmic protein NosX [Rhodovulum sp. P5]
MNRRRFLSISAAAVAVPGAACARTVWRGHALGAEAQVTLAGDRAAAQAVIPALTAELDRIASLFSLYRPDSALVRLNRAGQLSGPPPEMVELLTLCGQVHAATAGRFDPTVQPLWAALARGEDGAAEKGLIGWNRVEFGPDAITLGPGQALTLNGIAQGYATDRVADLLAGAGFTDVLVDIGEHRALGGPWRLGLRDPAFGLLGTRTLRDGAIATSSPAALSLGGAAHILSPTGVPLRWSTVSVEARTAAPADALSTALCMASRDEAEGAVALMPDVRSVTLVDHAGDLRTIRR